MINSISATTFKRKKFYCGIGYSSVCTALVQRNFNSDRGPYSNSFLLFFFCCTKKEKSLGLFFTLQERKRQGS